LAARGFPPAANGGDKWIRETPMTLPSLKARQKPPKFKSVYRRLESRAHMGKVVIEID
jgi:hypothetical protein